ncbi:MAG TPA: substrate-binding domain-containing protein, partial [Anaerolineales bacterium]|nr:substrate-binding domain-containing protein [Anaerolineales bacterium]
MSDFRNRGGKRATIAVLGAQFTRVWGGEFMAGVLDSARLQGVNVVCFAGGKPVPIPAQNGGRSYGLYDLIKPGQFDGILLAADIAHGLSADEVENFCRSLSPMPIASVAVRAPGVSSFMADNEGGMRAVVRHLIEEHQYTRIAFIRGPHGQIEAEQRYLAYREELKAHNIRFEEHLVVSGDFSPESGR